MRDHDGLDLAGRVRPEHLNARCLSHAERAISVEYRNRGRPRHADGCKLLDVMAQSRLVAAGPARDDQRCDVDVDPLGGALPGCELEFEHCFRCLHKTLCKIANLWSIYNPKPFRRPAWTRANSAMLSANFRPAWSWSRRECHPAS